MSSPRTVVSRERVVAPPDRLIQVRNDALLEYLHGILPSGSIEDLRTLEQLMAGISEHVFNRLRTRLSDEFLPFDGSLAGGVVASRTPPEELDEKEDTFLADLVAVLAVAGYSLLDSSTWDAALEETFLLTLPVTVDWSYLDSNLLKRFWQRRATVASRLPAQTRDRILILHRGVDISSLSGQYLDIKLDALASFLVLRPAYAAFQRVAKKLGVERRLGSELTPPPGMEAASAEGDKRALKVARRRAREVGEGSGHRATVIVERRTFTRVLDSASSTFRQLFTPLRLQEAAFRDCVVVYRKAGLAESSGGTTVAPARADVIRRGVVIKHFRSVPIADLEMIFPEKHIFVPPTVWVQLAATVLVALITVVAMIRPSKGGDGDGASAGSLATTYAALALLASRAFQIYSTVSFRRTAIEKELSSMLYEHSIASQDRVIGAALVEMATQHLREILLAWGVLATASQDGGRDLTGGTVETFTRAAAAKAGEAAGETGTEAAVGAALAAAASPDASPLATGVPRAELEARIERALQGSFGSHLRFDSGAALATLTGWGLVRTAGTDPDGEPLLIALPLADAIAQLRRVWNGVFADGKRPSDSQLVAGLAGLLPGTDSTPVA